MKIAKASQREIDTLMKWLQDREQDDDPPPPFMRVLFGYETMLKQCADPDSDILEFKPELLAAMHDKKLIDALGRHVEFQVHDRDLPCFAVIDPERRREMPTPLRVELQHFLERCFDERFE